MFFWVNKRICKRVVTFTCVILSLFGCLNNCELFDWFKLIQGLFDWKVVKESCFKRFVSNNESLIWVGNITILLHIHWNFMSLHKKKCLNLINISLFLLFYVVVFYAEENKNEQSKAISSSFCFFWNNYEVEFQPRKEVFPAFKPKKF